MAKALILKITLNSVANKVWRRIAVTQQTTYAQLHMIIQIAFGWRNEHLYGFTPSYNRALMYTDTADEYDDGFGEDAAEFTIRRDLQRGTVKYTYDFGDEWEHTIKLEKVASTTTNLPYILRAKGDGDWEDTGMNLDFDPEYSDAGGFLDAQQVAALNAQLSDWSRNEDFVNNPDVNDITTPREPDTSNATTTQEKFMTAFFDSALSQRFPDLTRENQQDMVNILLTSSKPNASNPDVPISLAELIRGLRKVETLLSNNTDPNVDHMLIAFLGCFILYLSTHGTVDGVPVEVNQSMFEYEQEV